MIRHFRNNAVAYVALFAALGGTSYAAVRLSTASVTSADLASGAVTHPKLAARSVGELDLVKGSLIGADLKRGTLRSILLASTRGPRGGAGVAGPQGPAGHNGDGRIVMRARGTGQVTAAHGASTDLPLSTTSWSQGSGELNLITGAMTVQIPASCTGSYGNELVISVDGIPNTFVVAPAVPASTQVTVPMVVSELSEPGAQKQHSIKATFANTCTQSGEDFTVSDLKIDVIALQ